MQTGAEQFAETVQEGTLNQVLVEQISDQPQFVWVLQTGESPGGEDNHATVDQTYSIEDLGHKKNRKMKKVVALLFLFICTWEINAQILQPETDELTSNQNVFLEMKSESIPLIQ